MQDGNFTYYTIQFKTIKVSHEWGNPESSLRSYKEVNGRETKWAFACFDSFGSAINPWADYKGSLEYPENKQIYEVWNRTGDKGWWDLAPAVQALKRLRTADKRGDFDSIDSTTYRKMQRVTHEFRIVRMEVSQKTTVMPN